jgi:YD repeat-containing protein
VDYTRDGMGRIASVSTTKDGVTSALATDVQYQPFGGLKSLTFGNGQTYSRTYDLDGRMASFTLNGVVQTVSYDAASRLTGIADAGNANNSRTYGYDQLDRLTSEQYHAVGNRTQSTLNAAATNYTYGATSNRLATAGGSTVTMDANGSTTNNGAGSQFSYDARGRMVSATTAIGVVTYKINALGQRVLKTTPASSTVFHYDSGGKLIAESSDGTATEYVWLDDVPVAALK